MVLLPLAKVPTALTRSSRTEAAVYQMCTALYVILVIALRAACHDIVSPPLLLLCTCADLNERLFLFVIETEDWLLSNAL